MRGFVQPSLPWSATRQDSDKTLALLRFHVLRPFLESDVKLTEIARSSGIPLRTLTRWVTRYRAEGLSGLEHRFKKEHPKRRRFAPINEIIEGLALKKPRLSVAAVHRELTAIATAQKQPAPSYSSVYRVVQQLAPDLLTLAHEGTKVYSDTFDLLHRTEAAAPNAIWQADHTLLDIWLLDEKRQPKKPWLTVILDDYSRTVAGYFLSFSAPSAIQTALALRQAIWRKPQAGWHVSGIPQILYTDHGSDFTSHFIERVAVDLKIRMIFSTVGKPRGRGKIERFFKSLNQRFLCHVPGYAQSGNPAAPRLTLSDLARELEEYLIHDYNLTPHGTTKVAPQERWEAAGFLPQMPESLEQLDLLLLTVPKTRRVQQDGIQFMGMRYIDPTLAAYVGEEVVLRYDPRDIAEIRVYHNDRYLCRAVCQELAGETVALREIVTARNRRRRELRQTIQDRRRTVDSLLDARRWTTVEDEVPPPKKTPRQAKLKRYRNE